MKCVIFRYNYFKSVLFEVNGFNFRVDDSKRCALQNSLLDIPRNQYQEHIPLAHTTEDQP